jgi:hypothetical protein
MSAVAEEHKSSKRNEVIIATIGLFGVLITGTLSNWDKLFPKENLMQATYSGYRPTGNLETEFRYYIEVSGLRQGLELMQKQLLSNAEAQAITENPSDAEEIRKVFSIIGKEAIKLDDVIREMLPVYEKYFSLAELQELNKFYSTEIMQGLMKKSPLIAQDAAPIQVNMVREYYQRVESRIREELKPKQDKQDKGPGSSFSPENK